jgi:integrase
MVHLLCCTLRYQRSGTKPRQDQLILSGQRRAEVAELRWSELDLDKRLWTLPSKRAKNGKQHTVPITDAMLAVLRRVPRYLTSDFVFTTTARTHYAEY